MSAVGQSAVPPRPGPPPNPESARFWDGLRSGQVLLQECERCGAVQHYPRALCRRCWCPDLIWVESSQRGSIYTWTVIHRPSHPAWADAVPYAAVIVELDEGPRLVASFDGNLADLVIGLPVEVAGRAEGIAATVVARPLPVAHPPGIGSA